jgi:hypothetical protein
MIHQEWLDKSSNMPSPKTAVLEELQSYVNNPFESGNSRLSSTNKYYSRDFSNDHNKYKTN